MKTLEPSFQMNADKTGIQTFSLVKREKDIAMYVRKTSEGRIYGYEVFKIKVVFAGTKFPNGVIVPETFESYPGCHAFGRLAFFYIKEEPANARFAKLLKDSSFLDMTDEEREIPPAPQKRGRKTLDRSAIVIPKTNFTIANLLEINTCSVSTIGNYVRSMLGIKFKIIEQRENKRGKPTIIYGHL